MTANYSRSDLKMWEQIVAAWIASVGYVFAANQAAVWKIGTPEWFISTFRFALPKCHKKGRFP